MFEFMKLYCNREKDNIIHVVSNINKEEISMECGVKERYRMIDNIICHHAEEIDIKILNQKYNVCKRCYLLTVRTTFQDVEGKR